MSYHLSAMTPFALIVHQPPCILVHTISRRKAITVLDVNLNEGEEGVEESIQFIQHQPKPRLAMSWMERGPG